jgi:hypothetical protein
MMTRNLVATTAFFLLLAAAAGAIAQEPADDDTDDKLPVQRPVESGPPDPLAQRFCDALHALPAARKAECCGGGSSTGLAGECTRVLSEAVRKGAVQLDRAAVDRCAQSRQRELAGCGWVRPQPPSPPEACRTVVAGRLADGAACRSSLACAAGLHCRASGSAKGVCTAPDRPGTACGQSLDLLTSYTLQEVTASHPDCSGYCHRGVCAETVALGGKCLSSGQCGRGNRCAAGQCVEGGDLAASTLKEAGETCSSPFECRGWCLSKPGATQGICGMQCGPTNQLVGR